MLACMETSDRLRRLQALRPPQSPSREILKPRSRVDGDVDGEVTSPFDSEEGASASIGDRRAPLEEMVAGEVWENEGGTVYVSTARSPLPLVRGAHALDELLNFAPESIAPLHPHSTPPASFRRAAFLDTETTGLGSSASTYAFMVGVGTIEPSLQTDALGERPLEYVVRQFFMRSPAEETALLVALADLLQELDLLVSFNGRTFDVPLLRMRYLYNRSFLPVSAHKIPLFDERAPHLDLLHPARRIWKRRLQSCRLVNLEAQVLGIERSGEDVSGALIPQMYVDYLRSGAGWEMARVFYHNREDIVTTAALAAQMGRMIHSPDAPESGVTAYEWLGLGERKELAGDYPSAVVAYRRALDAPDALGGTSRGDAFLRLGRTQKRMGAWQDAAETWELWLTTIPDAPIAPWVELAKYHEWQSHDYAQAAMWTAWALHTLKSRPVWQRPPGAIPELEQRLARLDKRMAGKNQGAATGTESEIDESSAQAGGSTQP